MVLLRQPESNENGIHIFAPSFIKNHGDYNAKGIDILYRAENTHFWFISRKEKIRSVFEKYVNRKDTILEIGAGSGNVAMSLIDAGYDVAVAEMHMNGLKYAQQYGIKKCYQFDLFDPPFANHFDTIGMFDVIEHLNNDLFALQQCRSMLKSHGRIVLTVPAFHFLWSRDDAGGHKRRYTIKGLKRVMQRAGFNILHSRYFFSVIFPLLVIRHFVKPDDGSPLTTNEYNNIEIKVNPLLNNFLLAICRIENKISRVFPNLPGGSIIMVGEKQYA